MREIFLAGFSQQAKTNVYLPVLDKVILSWSIAENGVQMFFWCIFHLSSNSRARHEFK
jgi:hypothetical protein